MESEKLVSVPENQLEELKRQLIELRTENARVDEIKQAAHNQTVAFRKAMNVIQFVQKMIPVDGNGNPDIDPMALMNIMMDKSKFKPIMNDLADLNQYIQEYEQKTLRILAGK